MADCSCKVESFAAQIKLLTETQPDFPQRFKQHLAFKSDKVANPFKFISGLLSKGVLCDGSSDSEGTFGLKETIVQFALIIACSKGADMIGGLMESLIESGNSELISALQTWVKEDFGIETEGDLSNSKGGISAASQTPTPHFLETQLENTTELSSSGTRLIDKIMSHEEKDFMEQLEGHLKSNGMKIVNAEEFCSILVSHSVIEEKDVKLITGKELQEEPWAEHAITVAFSKRALGSLVAAYQSSGNENVIQETLQWLQTSQVRKKNYPVAVKSLGDQAAPLKGLHQVATFTCQPEWSTSTKGPFAFEVNKGEMIAHLADGTVKLWNWQENENKTTGFGQKFKDSTCFQHDDEVIVLGTAEGTLHLYDAKTLVEKSSVTLGEPVHSLNFLESTLIILTRGADQDNFWWVDISRADMKLLNKRMYTAITKTKNSGFSMHQGYSFFDNSNFITVQNTKSGWQIANGLFTAPAEISTLNAVDLITTKTNVVAGCINGVIAMWNNCLTPSPEQTPIKNLRGHTEAIVSLCAVSGHHLSLDKKGKLLIWSGYDLEKKDVDAPVPRVLAENFSNVTSLVAHERWFVSSSSGNGVIKIWTLPDRWLRTGKFV